jgi:hypothetical protein
VLHDHQVWDGVESQQAAVLRLRKQGGSPSRTIAVSTGIFVLWHNAAICMNGSCLLCDFK